MTTAKIEVIRERIIKSLCRKIVRIQK